jgi:uncharacterized protein YdeI (YjbR/CyaY-like superfamily)
MKIKFFKTPLQFRKWLDAHHDKSNELLVGFYKKNSGKQSISWPEAVDEALCFGWIDGIRKSIDETSYMIRFTPRKSRSTWSAVNIKRVGELSKIGRMNPSGLKTFNERDQKRSVQYSYEQKNKKLDTTYEKKLRANKKAWNFFRAQAPWYQRTATWWIISAKREETRLKRLSILINDSEKDKRIPPLRRES